MKGISDQLGRVLTMVKQDGYNNIKLAKVQSTIQWVLSDFNAHITNEKIKVKNKLMNVLEKLALEEEVSVGEVEEFTRLVLCENPYINYEGTKPSVKFVSEIKSNNPNKITFALYSMGGITISKEQFANIKSNIYEFYHYLVTVGHEDTHFYQDKLTGSGLKVGTLFNQRNQPIWQIIRNFSKSTSPLFTKIFPAIENDNDEDKNKIKENLADLEYYLYFKYPHEEDAREGGIIFANHIMTKLAESFELEGKNQIANILRNVQQNCSRIREKSYEKTEDNSLDNPVVRSYLDSICEGLDLQKLSACGISLDKISHLSEDDSYFSSTNQKYMSQLSAKQEELISKLRQEIIEKKENYINYKNSLTPEEEKNDWMGECLFNRLKERETELQQAMEKLKIISQEATKENYEDYLDQIKLYNIIYKDLIYLSCVKSYDDKYCQALLRQFVIDGNPYVEMVASFLIEFQGFTGHEIGKIIGCALENKNANSRSFLVTRAMINEPDIFPIEAKEKLVQHLFESNKVRYTAYICTQEDLQKNIAINDAAKQRVISFIRNISEGYYAQENNLDLGFLEMIIKKIGQTDKNFQTLEKDFNTCCKYYYNFYNTKTRQEQNDWDIERIRNIYGESELSFYLQERNPISDQEVFSTFRKLEEDFVY